VTFHQDYLGIKQPAIGQLIRELRQTLKLTQEKFAAQLGVTFPTINRWENGHATPSPLALRQINALLDQLAESPDRTLRERCQVMREKHFPAKELKA
jgi:transcriptional regulator with XRE-family HTH domain